MVLLKNKIDRVNLSHESHPLFTRTHNHPLRAEPVEMIFFRHLYSLPTEANL